MKIISRILGRRLFKRFALWWYRITGQPATFTASGVYASMVALRIAEYDGPRASIVSGDSVAAAGELWFELIDGTRCTAIPGDRTDAFLTRIQHTVLIYKPQTVVLHLGGNDILADVDLDTIVGNLASIHKALRDGGVKRIGWIEILPLGEQFAEANKTAAELNAIVKKQLAYDVLEIRPKLQDARGFILPQYYGDGIHCNALAYNDVFYPFTAKYIRGEK